MSKVGYGKLVGFLASCTLLMAACGSAASTSDTRDVELCDGSNGLRLAYRVQAPIGRITPGEQVMAENGYDFLYLDGTCRYWVFPRKDYESSDDIWEDVVTGTLSAQQEQDLKTDLHVGEWHQWNKQTFVQRGTFDMSTETFWIPTAAFQCEGDCGSKRRRRIESNVRSWIRTLAEQGTSVNGPLRVVAVEMPQEWLDQDRSYPVQPAPSGLDIESNATSYAEARHMCYGQGFEVSNASVEILRKYRRDYRSGTYGDFWSYRYLPLKDTNGQIYMVYLRDSIPLEDADGLVELEGVPEQRCP